MWLRIEMILQSILDTTIAPSRSRRMWLNQIVASEDALFGPAEWDVLRDDAKQLQPGDEITLGFDGGLRDDSTALVALRVKDVYAYVLGLWDKPDGPQGKDWEVPPRSGRLGRAGASS